MYERAKKKGIDGSITRDSNRSLMPEDDITHPLLTHGDISQKRQRLSYPEISTERVLHRQSMYFLHSSRLKDSSIGVKADCKDHADGLQISSLLSTQEVVSGKSSHGYPR